MTGNGTARGCETFLDAVARSFGTLLQDCGFERVLEKDAWHAGRCLAVWRSPNSQLRFIYDRGSAEVYLGRAGATAGWAAGERDLKEWFALETVVDFVQKRRKRSRGEIRELASSLRKMTAEGQLEYLAGLLNPVAEQVFHLLGMDSQTDEWRTFEAYMASPRLP